MTAPNNVYAEFFEIADRGDEKEAKDFLLANLKRFPQDAQDAIVASFFDEALIKSTDGSRAVAEFQKEGLQTAGRLEQLKKELQKKRNSLK
jgi:hypothetical protein